MPSLLEYADGLFASGELVRGVVYGYVEKAYQEKNALFCCSSSSDIDGVDRVTMSKMEDKISLLIVELAATSERKKRDAELAERERQRDEKNATTKKEEEKRYAALQAQLKALFDSGKIISPCPNESSSEESDGCEESDNCEE